MSVLKYSFIGTTSPTHRPTCAKREKYLFSKKQKLGKLHAVLLFDCLLNEDIPIQRPVQILHYCSYGDNGFYKVHSKQEQETTCHAEHGNEGEKATETLDL